MRRKGVVKAVLVFSMMVFLLALGTGCTKYASEEDLQNLENQKQAALSAEKKVEQLKVEKEKLEQIKAEKEAELQAAKAEKAAVAERIEALSEDQAESMGLTIGAEETTEGEGGEE
jgi:biopolymer transport protein ExbB/TolQ